MVVTGGGLPDGVTINTVTNATNFVLSSAQNIPVNSELIYSSVYIFKLATAGQQTIPVIGSYLPGEFTDYVKVINIKNNIPSAGKYTIATDSKVSSFYLQQNPSTPDDKYAYSINSIGWYSYKIVVKQQEQDYYNVYLPGILSGYPDQTGTPPPFPSDPPGSTANIVLFNDNINKIPRDLSEVGPQQKQFRSSVKLFGRVENNIGTTNIQYYPGISTDTAVSISTADDSNMVFTTLGANGKLNFYQIDTNPLIARLATNNNNIIGDVTATMRPFLAIYETEPQESLLDIYWETPTVGLISDLNDAINSSYEGAVGWGLYDSSLFTENSVGNFLPTDISTPLFPVNQQGQNLTNTTISTVTVVDASGQTVTSNFNQPTKNANGSYNFSKSTDDFVYEQDAALRQFTITATITNLAVTPNIVSNPLQIDIQLQNIIPLITPVAIDPIPKNTGDSGVITTMTGVNGAARTSLNQNELQWSMTGGGVYFSINSSNGEITQVLNTPAATYYLLVTLTDANGTGLPSATVTQRVVVSSQVVGFFFEAGQADGSYMQVCPTGNPPGSDPVAPTCGLHDYWNTTRSSGTPVAGDVISTSPTSIVFAPYGYYSFDCGNGTGTSRKFFFIDATNDGVVASVQYCT